MLPGCLDLGVAKAIRKIQFKEPAVVAAGNVKVLPGKPAVSRPVQGIKDIAYRGLECAIALEDRPGKTAIDAPQSAGFESAFPDGGRIIEAADFCRPAFSQLCGLLGVDIRSKNI